MAHKRKRKGGKKKGGFKVFGKRIKSALPSIGRFSTL